jgi:glycosyltransferase involved in cell wall biosynthesis
MPTDEAIRPQASKRILIVSNLFPPHVLGGAEVVAHRQAMALAARGHSVSVFAGWIASTDQRGYLEVENQDGLQVWRVPLISFEASDNFYNSTVGNRLRSALEVERPDLVHFHNVAGLGFNLIALVRRLGIAAIVTLHDHAGYCYRATALRPDGTQCQDTEQCALACDGAIQPQDSGIALPMRLRRDYVAWTLAQAHCLISPSHALAEAYKAARIIEPSRLRVISNGIDVEQFQTSARPSESQLVRFTCVAYLAEHKGIPDLLDAAALLAADPELTGRWSLAIAGDGHLRHQVENEIASGRFGDAVTFLGRVPRPRIIAEMERTDVLVLPSRWPENEPVVLLEAIAAGVAQLATAVGGMPDLIQPGMTGELVPPADPGCLAQAMAAYIHEPERARRQGEANLSRRHLFSQNASVTQVEAVYEAALQVVKPPSEQQPVVICAGDWPLLEVAEMCSGLHHLEKGGLGIRLIWHEWADAQVWQRASLLWNWSSGANRSVIQRALRAGIPVLAPRSCSVAAGIASTFGAAFVYDTFLEGMLALARLPFDRTTQQSMRRNCRMSAKLLDDASPTELYRFHS